MAQDRPLEEKVDADDRRGLEGGVGIAEDRAVPRAAWRRRCVRLHVRESLDAGFRLDGGARGLERAPGRVPVHPAERAGGQDHVTRLAPGEERSSHREDAPCGARLVRADVERRPDEDVPEALDGCVGATEVAKERAERLVVRPRPRQAAHGVGNTEPVG
jgi:hypothetical protein